MNYQTSALLFYKPLYLVLGSLAIIGTLFGYSSVLGYLLLAGLVFPVVVSMRIHRLNESGTALTIKENSEWLVYVHGLPVREQRAILGNPCFLSPRRTRQFFLRGFLARLAIQVACLVMLYQQFQAHDLTTLSVAIAGISLLALLFVFSRTLLALRQLLTDSFRTEIVTSPTGSVWYQGFFSRGEARSAGLERLLSIR